MIIFKRHSEKDLSVEMYDDGKLVGIFPTEKRGRLFYEGIRDKEGNKIDPIDEQNETVSSSETVNVDVEASNESGNADQKNGEPKRRGRKPKKVGIDDRGKSI